MISLGLVIFPGILLYILELDLSDSRFIFLAPGMLFGSLIFSSIVCSYFELQLPKRNWSSYLPLEKESIGRGLSIFYGIVFLFMGIFGPSMLLVSSEVGLLSKLGFLYIGWIASGIFGIVGGIVYRDTPMNHSLGEELKRRKIGFSVVMICIIILTTAILFLNTSAPYYRKLNVNQDAYVYEYHPNTNFGQDTRVFVGNYEFGKAEAYYQFDISEVSDGWKEAKLEVRFDFASYPVNVGVCMIYESWDESTITWNNRPNRTALFGHILCDGFNFHASVKPKHFVNSEITICLYGRGAEKDGYLSGNSKEGASNDDNIPLVSLRFKGINPNFFPHYIIAYVVIIAVAVLYLKYAGRFSYPQTRPRTHIPMERSLEHRLNEIRLRSRMPPRPVNRLVGGDRLQPRDFYNPRKVFKINELVDLRLIGNRTYLFVNNIRLIVCTFLLINIPKDKVQDYDEIKSIDEAAELLDKSLERIPPYFYKITPEEEFKAHCSNIQAFFENGLNTNILHTNIAFPLLKELVRQGFEPAQKVFKEEIAIRFNEGTFNSRRFLYLQGYLNYLSEEEKQVLEGYEDFIKNFRERTINLRENFMGDRFLNERPGPIGRIFEREDGMRIFDKITIFGDLGVGKNTLHQIFLTNSGPDTRVTLGVNIGIKNIIVNNQSFGLRIWNITGGPHFRSLHSLYFQGAIGGIFIYDITNQSSLTHLDDWLFTIQLRLRGGNRFPIIIVGNKLDLAENRKVPVEYAIKLAKSRGMNGYIECSFQTGKNVEKIFERLVRIILKQQRENT